MDKKVYSLNLMAFVQYITGYKPKLDINNEGEFFALFPENEEVNKTIESFRCRDIKVDLHKYLRIFRQIKKDISKRR